MQMDNDQTIYTNRTLTLNLQQPAQETSPLSTINSPGSQPAIGQTGRKPDHCLLVTIQEAKQ